MRTEAAKMACNQKFAPHVDTVGPPAWWSDGILRADRWFTTCTPQGRAGSHADPLPAFFIRRGGWLLDRFKRRDVEPRAIGTYFAGSCDHCISIQASSSPRVPHRSSMTLSC